MQKKSWGQNMNSTFQGMKYHAPKTASSFSSHGGFSSYFLALAISPSTISAHAQPSKYTKNDTFFHVYQSNIQPTSYSETGLFNTPHPTKIVNREIYELAMTINDIYQNLASVQTTLGEDLEEAIYDGIWELYGK